MRLANAPWYSSPLALALLLTAANLPKPPLVDDPAYLALARQIASKPLDPYGFEQFWYQAPMPANTVLAPPVVPYWLGLGIRLFGERIVVLKLWLFPFALLLTVSLRSLLHRFARGMEGPGSILAVVSPQVLPAMNFMLDVPTLALGLAAVATFLRACDRRSVALAAVAGLLTGIAIETKYTALLVPPALVVSALIFRRLGLAFVSSLVAAAVFLAWEGYVHRTYGISHFQYHAGNNDLNWWLKFDLAGAIGSLLGGVAVPAALLAMAAIRWLRGGVRYAIGVVLGGYLLLAAVPMASAILFEFKNKDQTIITVASVWFGFMGYATIAVASILILTMAARPRWRMRRNRATWFLLAWLAIEVGGYFALTPFPATRRLMGTTVVFTLLAARLASRTLRESERTVLRSVVRTGAVLGLLYAGTDIADSMVQPYTVRLADSFIRERDPEPVVWFTGHWGMQYEAERLGMKPVIPGGSLLRAGDWLVLPSKIVNQQLIRKAEPMGEPETVYNIGLTEPPFPLRTNPTYYGGFLPMDRWPYARASLLVYRIRADWVPQDASDDPPENEQRPGATAPER